MHKLPENLKKNAMKWLKFRNVNCGIGHPEEKSRWNIEEWRGKQMKVTYFGLERYDSCPVTRFFHFLAIPGSQALFNIYYIYISYWLSEPRGSMQGNLPAEADLEWSYREKHNCTGEFLWMTAFFNFCLLIGPFFFVIISTFLAAKVSCPVKQCFIK